MRCASNRYIDDVLDAMRHKHLATDKIHIAGKMLSNRQVTCQQAVPLLKEIKHGIPQRLFCKHVLRTQLADMPHGLDDMVSEFDDALLQKDIALLVADGMDASLPIGKMCPRIPVSSSRLTHAKCVQRLRTHARGKRLPADVVEDLAEMFDLLGLDPLQSKDSDVDASEPLRSPSASQVPRSLPALPSAKRRSKRRQDTAPGDAEGSTETRTKQKSRGTSREKRALPPAPNRAGANEKQDGESCPSSQSSCEELTQATSCNTFHIGTDSDRTDKTDQLESSQLREQAGEQACGNDVGSQFQPDNEPSPACTNEVRLSFKGMSDTNSLDGDIRLAFRGMSETNNLEDDIKVLPVKSRTFIRGKVPGRARASATE
eukprot:TRINITY_DN16881_c0_g2_i1.p1 TRINITY_DN16881_c0_g2~~TRINITY_DN16881_c0_g2_i1.p1  ORF type:complete len:373 (+),score=56.69 TRINITY_DN16881_c0_g2_i1:91-1209(+)